jgi:hypothetical protein
MFAMKMPHIVAMNAVAIWRISTAGSSPADASVAIKPMTVPMMPIVGE